MTKVIVVQTGDDVAETASSIGNQKLDSGEGSVDYSGFVAGDGSGEQVLATTMSQISAILFWCKVCWN